MTYYPINEDTAKRANDANSFRDYKPGSATAAYRAEVDKAAALVEKQKAKVDSMHHDKLDGLLDRYAHRLADYYNDYYRNEAACPSILITGGANFPVAKKEKQNARRDTLAHEYADIQGLLRKIESVGMGGISADDPNAIEKLEEKLARLERTQQTMKDINAYYRKHGTLDGCTLASEEAIRKIKADMKSSWRFSDKPFESYTLSNQNAEIRRLRGRIEELRKQKTEPPPAGWAFDGGEVVVNTSANRLQIIFDDKPDDDLRQELKQNGFRWAPSVGVWQRQLTKNALYAAKRIEALAPVEK